VSGQTSQEKRENRRLLAGELLNLAARIDGDGTQDYPKITVNKRTHRIRYEDESEDEVTIMIERIPVGP
jgi:hypothetical protein